MSASGQLTARARSPDGRRHPQSGAARRFIACPALLPRFTQMRDLLYPMPSAISAKKNNPLIYINPASKKLPMMKGGEVCKRGLEEDD